MSNHKDRMIQDGWEVITFIAGKQHEAMTIHSELTKKMAESIAQYKNNMSKYSAASGLTYKARAMNYE